MVDFNDQIVAINFVELEYLTLELSKRNGCDIGIHNDRGTAILAGPLGRLTIKPVGARRRPWVKDQLDDTFSCRIEWPEKNITYESQLMFSTYSNLTYEDLLQYLECTLIH